MQQSATILSLCWNQSHTQSQIHIFSHLIKSTRLAANCKTRNILSYMHAMRLKPAEYTNTYKQHITWTQVSSHRKNGLMASFCINKQNAKHTEQQNSYYLSKFNQYKKPDWFALYMYIILLFCQTSMYFPLLFMSVLTSWKHIITFMLPLCLHVSLLLQCTHNNSI